MNAVVKPEKKSINEVGMSAHGAGATLAPESLGDVVRFAEVMAQGGIALPKHLRGEGGACMAVAMQALQWEMNPFAVASKSYSVNGNIAYEAQLIAAVVNTRSGIKGRLKYEFTGEGDELRCKVSGELDGDVCEYNTPPMKAITTRNSPLWKTDPEQQLGYYAARSWARRHCPEVLLGVYDKEEVETFHGPDNAKDVTPSAGAKKYLAAAPETAESLGDANIRQATDGFDPKGMESEIETLKSSGEIETGSPDVADGPVEPLADPSAPDIEVLQQVKDVLFAILDADEYEMVSKPDEWARARSKIVMGRLQEAILSEVSPKTHEAAKGVLDVFLAVVDGKQTVEGADEWFAEAWGA